MKRSATIVALSTFALVALVTLIARVRESRPEPTAAQVTPSRRSHAAQQENIIAHQVDSTPAVSLSPDVALSTREAPQLREESDPVDVYQLTHARPRDIMELESREPSFASSRELELRTHIEDRLTRSVRFPFQVGVKCYTSSCELTVCARSVDGDLDAALKAIDLPALADVAEIGTARCGSEQAPGLSAVMLFSARMKNANNFRLILRAYQEGR
jgi:hypothetical protein